MARRAGVKSLGVVYRLILLFLDQRGGSSPFFRFCAGVSWLSGCEPLLARGSRRARACGGAVVVRPAGFVAGGEGAEGLRGPRPVDVTESGHAAVSNSSGSGGAGSAAVL